MEEFDRKKHWENIYESKPLTEVSWYQPVPETSLAFMEKLNIPKDARIIDVGGGDSFFAEFLLDRGFTNITVLDISEASLERAKKRLGDKAGKIKFVLADVTIFKAEAAYDFWHDRAAFHFLTNPDEVTAYLSNAASAVAAGGYAVVGTFSENGPLKCSGIPIMQYSTQELTGTFSNYFTPVECFNEDHPTPFGTVQNFTFCSFRTRSLK